MQRLAVLAVFFAIAAGCGSSDSSSGAGPSDRACTPGQSSACVGANACKGFQVCTKDGSAFGDCQCGTGDDSGDDGGPIGSGGSSSLPGGGHGGTSAGGSSAGGSGSSACVPGASVSCVGPGACQGGQVCNADGTGYGACECASGGGGSSSGGSGSGDDGGDDGGSGGTSGAMNPECQACVSEALNGSACSSYAAACGANPDCFSYIGCDEDEPDAVCAQEFPNGVADANAWVGCAVCDQCMDKCPGSEADCAAQTMGGAGGSN